MPLFDYQCEACNNQFTELRKGSEKDLPISCPQCGKETSKRLVTGFSMGGGGGSYSPPSAPTSGFT